MPSNKMTGNISRNHAITYTIFHDISRNYINIFVSIRYITNLAMLAWYTSIMVSSKTVMLAAVVA